MRACEAFAKQRASLTFSLISRLMAQRKNEFLSFPSASLSVVSSSGLSTSYSFRAWLSLFTKLFIGKRSLARWLVLQGLFRHSRLGALSWSCFARLNACHF
jgi:hypothetical protein